jgi:hypothetical protein
MQTNYEGLKNHSGEFLFLPWWKTYSFFAVAQSVVRFAAARFENVKFEIRVGSEIPSFDTKSHFVVADVKHSQNLVIDLNGVPNRKLDAGKLDRRLTHEDLLA